MRHTLLCPFRDKSGMATVLGMLIFVGVLFTCVIPLFLYVNKVNSIYDTAVTRMRQFDQDRESERIDVYAYPSGNPPDKISIYVKNKRPLSVKIVRVWINDDPFNFSFQISAMEGRTIEPILVDLTESKAFYIKVMTSRGDLFSSFTNPLYYTSGDGGGWSGGMGLTVQIVIETVTEPVRFFHINVTNLLATPPFIYTADVVKRAHESSCLTVVTVPYQATYLVTVTDNQGILLKETDVAVDLNNPSGFVHVDAT